MDDVGVDHGGAHIFVSEQFLDGANIVAFLEKMRGIEWKGGALHSCEYTFPPRPLQTGRQLIAASGFAT